MRDRTGYADVGAAETVGNDTYPSVATIDRGRAPDAQTAADRGPDGYRTLTVRTGVFAPLQPAP